MKNKILKMGVLLFFLSFMLVPAENSQAATKKIGILTSYGKSSCKVDLDGDGKKETLKLKTTLEYDFYIKDADLYVNDKKVLSFHALDDVINISMDYCKMTNSKIFIRLVLSGDSDIVHLDNFYKYNAKEKKMFTAGKLLDVNGACTETIIKNVSSTEIKVSYRRQFPKIGSILWTSNYIVKDDKLKLKSNMSKATCAYRGNNFYYQDEYGKKFEKNEYEAMRKFKLYTDTSLKNVSFSAEKGNILILKNIKFVKDRFYVQFGKGRKTGWIKVEPSNGHILFYGVSYRLAG